MLDSLIPFGMLRNLLLYIPNLVLRFKRLLRNLDARLKGDFFTNL
jgi:hypothetical protein